MSEDGSEAGSNGSGLISCPDSDADTGPFGAPPSALEGEAEDLMVSQQVVLFVEMLEDAYEALLQREITPEVVPGTTAVLIRFPVPGPVRAVLRCEDRLLLFIKFEHRPGGWAVPRVSLAPSQERDFSVVTQFWRSQAQPPSTDQTTLCYTKALLLAIANDMDVAFLMDRPGLAAERVRDRISVQDENFAGVFRMPMDVKKVDVEVAEIVGEAMGVMGGRMVRNAVLRAVDVVEGNLRRLGERCYLCGTRHRPQPEVPVPLPCCNYLCRFRSCNTMYVNLYSEIKSRPLVVQLLMRLAHSAISSYRAEIIFTPTPPGLEMRSLQMLFSQLPTVEDMSACENEASIKAAIQEQGKRTRESSSTTVELSSCNSSLYKLLWWIIMNIPNYISEVPLDEHPAIMEEIQSHPVEGGTPLDTAGSLPPSIRAFKITSHLTSLNRTFLELRALHGSAYAFHGSPQENWYSLLKHGMRNMSDEGDYRVHGAAHGKGVYLARSYRKALRYASGELSIVGVVEVVKMPQLGQWDKGWCIVVPEAECISIKYILVEGSKL